jgi:protein-S-isoprenylcysteine O-methyltransferase Ste14
VSSRAKPALVTILFLFVAPGTVVGLVPWLLSGWIVQPPLLGWPATRWIGVALIALGVPVLLESFYRFAWVGRGSPAPPFPTQTLVVTGFYRFVRNPMYVAVASMILGQGLLFGSVPVLVWGAIVIGAFHTFVLLYEEPKLRETYGESYLAYCRAVRRWWPRVTPYRPTPPATA